MAKASGTQKWEQSEFPSACEGCLGPNPHMRMTKEPFGQECKICLKPFTIFKWSTGPQMRFRRTEICQTCSRLKNICQSCMFDLDYGLPVQIRDSVLKIADVVPRNEVNREYFIASNAARLGRGEVGLIDYDRADPAGRAVLQKLAEKIVKPKLAKKNLPAPCSFWAKGKCTRGLECPFRHALVHETPSTLKNYRARYFGQGDQHAEKIVEKNAELLEGGAIRKPEDKSITSLFVTGLRSGIDAKQDLIPFFNAFGPVRGVKVVADGTAAIVSFRNREAAEDAAEQTLGITAIKGVSVQVSWSKYRVRPEEDRVKADAYRTESHQPTAATTTAQPLDSNDHLANDSNPISLQQEPKDQLVKRLKRL